MDENKMEIEIELSEDAWSVLEDCRIEDDFDTIDDLIGYILENFVKESEIYNVNDINDKAVNL